jgi:hypothetical protein
MSGPPPKLPGQRSARAKKPVSDWKAAPEGGWKGDAPEVPVGLMPASQKAWALWFSAWWAANWTPEDVPQLELAVKLYDCVQRGDTKEMTRFQSLADSLGLTPKGRASLRWLPPTGEAETVAQATPNDLEARRAARQSKLA